MNKQSGITNKKTIEIATLIVNITYVTKLRPFTTELPRSDTKES